MFEDPNTPPRIQTVASSRSLTRPTRRILVVEDDVDIRRLNTEVLIQSGYHVDAAEDGDAAWERLRAHPYDLLLTDNEMPRVSGLVLIAMIHAAGRALPVIMATARMPIEELERQPWLHPTATLLKPYTVEELLGTVKGVLGSIDGPRLPAPSPSSWQDPPSADQWRV